MSHDKQLESGERPVAEFLGRMDEPAHLSDVTFTDKSTSTLSGHAAGDTDATAMTTVAMPACGTSTASSLLQISSKEVPLGNFVLDGNGGPANADPLLQASLLQSRNSSKTLKCPRCNWHYTYRQTLDAHMEEKHVGEVTEYFYCDASEPRSRLARGENHACGRKPFKCEICDYSTTTKGNLFIHAKSDKHLNNAKTTKHRRSSGVKTNEKEILASPTRQVCRLPTTNGMCFSSGGSPIEPESSYCDVFNCEAHAPRDLCAHMQSEKQAGNDKFAVQDSKHQHFQKTENIVEQRASTQSECTYLDGLRYSNGISRSELGNNPSTAAMHNDIALIQHKKSKHRSDNVGESDDRHRNVSTLLRSVQQYQKELARLSRSGDTSGSVPDIVHQQIVLQQQLQIWRQLLSRTDDSKASSGSQALNGVNGTIHDCDETTLRSKKFMFACRICCSFSCDNFESLRSHVRAFRYPTTSSADGNEWATVLPDEGYLCRICYYSTQIKSNFSLHCKTEKHTSKLQLIRHIKEGGDNNGWKVERAITGSYMNEVTCNGCGHSFTSVEKLATHCSTDGHRRTLAMCHNLDAMMKEAELKTALGSTDEISSHQLVCRPCSYQSKYVVDMILHLQREDHRYKVGDEKQGGKGIPVEMVAVNYSENESGESKTMEFREDQMDSTGDASETLSEEEKEKKPSYQKNSTSRSDSESSLNSQRNRCANRNSSGGCQGERGSENTPNDQSSETAIGIPTVNQIDENDREAIFADPRSPLANVCAHTAFASEAIEDKNPPYRCSAGKDACLQKTDLLDHLTNSPAHKADAGQNPACPSSGQGHVTAPGDQTHKSPPDGASFETSSESEAEGGLKAEDKNTKENEVFVSRDEMKLSALGGANEPCKKVSADDEDESALTAPNFDFSLLVSHERKHGGTLYPGISRTTHKRVLWDVGLDHVAQFVENRDPENRKKAKLWKKARDEHSDVTIDEGENNGNGSIASRHTQQKKLPLTCGRCGKEFSNVWILRVHEKLVHGIEMPPEILEEFVRGYTEWYWSDVKSKDGKVEKSDGDNAQRSHIKEDGNPPNRGITESVNMPHSPETATPATDFQQAAMQSFLMNFPGVLSPHGGAMSQPENGEKSILQLQQTMLQMYMALQAQITIQQQLQRHASSQDQTQGSYQASAVGLMNALVDHLSGPRANSGLTDHAGLMAFLQQQGNLPGPYQWLGMGSFQEQQLMQQLLLTYPGMALGNTGLPFMLNLRDKPNQQQHMQAALAAGLLTSSGLFPNPPGYARDGFVAGSNGRGRLVRADGRAAANGSEVESAEFRVTGNCDLSSSPLLNRKEAETSSRRVRTRITDDQLAILRSHFDITASQTEEQISEVASKTDLPPKVVKHWFRNTLFKERQRSKDSPYNFSIPPVTSLNVASDDVTNTANNAVDENSFSNAQKIVDAGDKANLLKLNNERKTSIEEFPKNHSVMPENKAIPTFEALSVRSKKDPARQPSFFNDPMPFFPGINCALGGGSIQSPSTAHISHFCGRRGSGEDRDFGDGRRTRTRPPSDGLHLPTTVIRRTPRTRFSDRQLKVLQEFFDKNAYPTDGDLNTLSRTLELSTRVVVVWFQNARQKARKSYGMQHSTGNSGSYLSGSSNCARKWQSPPTSPQSQTQKPHASAQASSTERDQEQKDGAANISNFKCSQCDATLPTYDALLEHERLHSVVRRYKMRSKENISKSADESPKLEPGSSDTTEKRLSGDDVTDDTTSQHDANTGSVASPSFQSEHLGLKFQAPTASVFEAKQTALSPPPIYHSPLSLASPNGSGMNGLHRKESLNDSCKDSKRLRTTITPEQLEYLYQRYLVDSSPSRNVIERISDVVGLKKRVVQVWFQNTRARERKGQFRSVGRITSLLGMPQICPHCRAAFRNKSEFESHARSHRTQPFSTDVVHTSSHELGRERETRPAILKRSLSDTPAPSCDKSIQYLSASKPCDDRKIFSSSGTKTVEKSFDESVKSCGVSVSQTFSLSTSYFGFPVGVGTHFTQNECHRSSPKRRLTSGSDVEHPGSFVTSQSLPYSSVDAAAQSLRERAASSTSGHSTAPNLLMHDAPPSQMTSSVCDRRETSPSSPESRMNCIGPFSTAPPRRHRTQMTSLQVRCMKYCFSEFKTPTLVECEMLGTQIGLPKRVIQVWFQNTRAKDRKANSRKLQSNTGESLSKFETTCDLCPNARFSSQQDYRNHVFSKAHIHKFMSACSGDTSDASSRVATSFDIDECSPKKTSTSGGHEDTCSLTPPPSDATNFRIAAIAANGYDPHLSESRGEVSTSASRATTLKTSALLSNYQQLAAIQKLAVSHDGVRRMELSAVPPCDIRSGAMMK